jgi:aldehyde dehydrogenase (NAD+)
MCEVGEGNRKDVRNAVEAARAAKTWSALSAHGRAQVLYYLAENLDARRKDFVDIIREMTDRSTESAEDELAASIELIFTYAAWADKFDGAVHATPIRGMTLALPEPLGVIGIGCPAEQPLAGILSVVLPAIAMGNRVVAVASEQHPLAAVELYHVLDTSDVPGGVINILTGPTGPLIETLASHDDLEAVWFWGSKELGAQVQRLSTGNLKQTWVHGESALPLRPTASQVNAFLHHATQVKNIWIPFTDEVSW